MITAPVTHQHFIKGGGFRVDCELFMPGEGEFTVAYAYAKTKQAGVPKGFRELNRSNGGDDSVFPRGQWVRVMTGLPVGSARRYTDLLFQFRIKDPPADAGGFTARFVRVYRGGKRDGTGDQWYPLPAPVTVDTP